MKYLSMICTGIVLCGMGSAAVAQQSARPATTTIDQQDPATQLDRRTQGATFRASKLIGMEVHNPQGKQVGEINDLVMDVNSGKIQYAAVTYGGFLGIGNKMFAVPFEAFKMQRDRDDANEIVLVLNVTQEQLEGSVGFDEESWPNFADEGFTTDLDRRYQIDRRRSPRGVDVNIDRNGLDVDIDRNPGDRPAGDR